MAPDDSSGAKPAGPVVLRIKLRYDDVDAMVQRFATNVGKSGLFLPTKSIQPVGTEIKFELKISNDTAVLVGLGRVRAARQPDPANPKAAFGMAIELMRVTREGRELIMRMLERRRVLDLPDVAIPMPEDVDAARRADVETQPKVEVAATVRDATPRQSSPIVPAEQLLTAPRPGSGPIGRGKGEPMRPSAPALAPEPTKAKRPRIADMIAKANESSGALAAVAVPGLDEHVDVERALVRARALAGGDVDTELAALLESSAAPNEISIEAASAELARQLGGAPIVKRDRSARWAPPPAIGTTLPEGRPTTDPDADVAAVAVAAAAPASATEAVAIRDPDPEPPPSATSKRKSKSRSRSASRSTSQSVSEPASESVATSEAVTTSESVAASELASESVSPSVPASVSEPRSVAASEAVSVSAPRPVATSELPSATDPDAASDFRAPSVSDATATSDTIDVLHDAAHFRRAKSSSSEMDQLAAEQAIAIAAHEAGAITAVEPDPEPSMLMAADEPESSIEPSMQPSMPVAAEPEPAAVIDIAPPTTPPTTQPAMLIDDDADLASFENALDAARIHTGATQAAPESPEGGDDEEQLDSLDLELADESTEIGALPIVAVPFQPQAYATPDELADRLDQQLAAAEAEANSDFAIALQPAPQPAYETVEADEDFSDEEISELDVLAEADADDADLLNSDGERDASDSHEAPAAAPPPEYDFAAQLDFGDDESIPPAADKSPPLLGDYDTGFDTPSSYTIAEEVPQAPSTFDDPQAFATVDFDEPHQFSQPDDPRHFGAQPQAYSESNRLTPPSETFDEPHGFAASERPRGRTSVANPPRPTRDPLPSSPAMLHTEPDDDFDLEDALSTLDVDLDRLEIPRDPPSQSRARPLPGMPPERAPVEVETVRPGGNSSRVPKEAPRSTAATLNAAKTSRPPRAKRAVTEDEGVLIDFDDDE